MDKDKKRAGFYFQGDRPYISVTSVLKIIDKSDVLLRWAARETYFAMVKNPNITETEATSAHLKTRDSAASRGHTIHSLIDLFRSSGAVIDQVPPPFQGYYTSFKKWLDKNSPEFVVQEKSIFDEALGIGGTFDALVKINNKFYLVDFKTNREGNIYPEVQLQLSAYAYMARKSGLTVDGVLAVGLSENGTYNERFFTENYPIFLHTLELWKWKNEELLKKVGFKVGGE